MPKSRRCKKRRGGQGYGMGQGQGYGMGQGQGYGMDQGQGYLGVGGWAGGQQPMGMGQQSMGMGMGLGQQTQMIFDPITRQMRPRTTFEWMMGKGGKLRRKKTRKNRRSRK